MKDRDDDNEEDDEAVELTTNTDWGGALSSLRLRMSKLSSNGSAVLFDMLSSQPPSTVITDFLETAQPLVINAMSDAVAGIIGGMGSNPTLGISVTAKVTGSKLGALCFQLQMTGYMFRNAEYVLALKELMSIEAHSTSEYKAAFSKIDVDSSGYIERDEIRLMLAEVYAVDPPDFELDTFLRFFDANGDGKISWGEFEKGLGVVNSERAAGAVGKQFQFPNSNSKLEDDVPESPTPTLSGMITVEVEDGKTIEIEAKDYVETLRAEAEALKEALKREARDSTANSGLTTGLDAGSPTAGGGLGGYLDSLNQENVRALTEGITPDVVDTMKMLVKYVLDGGPNKQGAIEMEQEIDIPAGALQQLCLWQLVLGYRLREKEAEGDYKEKLGNTMDRPPQSSVSPPSPPLSLPKSGIFEPSSDDESVQSPTNNKRRRIRSQRWLEQDTGESLKETRRKSNKKNWKRLQGGGDGGEQGIVNGSLSPRIVNSLLFNFGPSIKEVGELRASLTELFSPSSPVYSSLLNSPSFNASRVSFVKSLLTRDGVGVNVGVFASWVGERERMWEGWYQGGKMVEGIDCANIGGDDEGGEGGEQQKRLRGGGGEDSTENVVVKEEAVKGESGSFVVIDNDDESSVSIAECKAATTMVDTLVVIEEDDDNILEALPTLPPTLPPTIPPTIPPTKVTPSLSPRSTSRARKPSMKKMEASQSLFDNDDDEDYVQKGRRRPPTSARSSQKRTTSTDKGWSNDRLMNRYVWCNAYRELDRGTRYFRSQVKGTLHSDFNAALAMSISPQRHRLRSVLWAAFLYRRANNIETWRSLGGIPAYPVDDDGREKVRALKDRFAKVSSSQGFFAKCHIDSSGMMKYKADIEFLQRTKKVKSVISTSLDWYAEGIEKAMRDGKTDYDKVKGVCNKVNEMPGIGDFFAWQITCDLLESSVLYTPPNDRIVRSTDYCRLGPGAISGLERILTGKVGVWRGSILWREAYCGSEVCGSREEDAHALTDALSFLLDSVMKVLFGETSRPMSPFGLVMDAKNLEHSLCEFGKYCNLREDEKWSKKRNYTPRVDRDGCGGDRKEVGGKCGVKSVVYCIKCTDGFCGACKEKAGMEIKGVYVCKGCLELEGGGDLVY